MIKDNLKTKGQLVIEKTNAVGEVERTEVNNLVVDSGIEYILKCTVSDSNADSTPDRPDVMSHMAIGTDSTAQVASDTSLGTEVASGGRQGLVSTTLNSATNSMEFVCLFDVGEGTGAIVESGIFNSASGGTMLARTTFPVVNKEPLDKLTITWVISLAAV